MDCIQLIVGTFSNVSLDSLFKIEQAIYLYTVSVFIWLHWGRTDTAETSVFNLLVYQKCIYLISFKVFLTNEFFYQSSEVLLHFYHTIQLLFLSQASGFRWWPLLHFFLYSIYIQYIYENRRKTKTKNSVDILGTDHYFYKGGGLPFS